jgi:trehalose/maltose hydrolase-like predicted phosphorylase
MSRSFLVLIPAVLVLGGANAYATGEDAGFVLRAEAKDLPVYFPGYLGNGYIGTLTAPRGTEPTRSYLVGFMDYTGGDMSRPAAVPAWNEVDFSASAPGAGLEWLNRAPVNERRFDAWQQTLDERAGALTTSYRYLDHGRTTAVEVTTLVSEASPHLAATRFTITPDYDGIVHLSFPLMLWADHAPRFPLAEMTGSEMEQAVAAYGLTLEPSPPATSDREAVWYPGYTQVTASDGNAGSLSLWLDGKAPQGLTMAMAAAVALPAGAIAETVTLQRGRYRLALDVAFRVERGRTYAFTKYVALSRAGWGGNSTEDLALAREARRRGFEALLTEQRTAWDALWQSDILIEGDPRAQQVAHSELYYLLASSTPDTAWSPGPDALTPAYTAHVFWDTDTWMFPALLLLHPERARSMVAFRERTLEAAQQRARQHGFAGAMFPWESDPENGSDQTPHSAVVLADTEIHVTADVAIAQWQYYLATGDRAWLREHGWPVIREAARFWASRATYDAPRKRYDIAHVTSVAESYNDIPNDTFTNVSAARVLEIATAAAKLVGEPADPQWERIAKLLYIPMTKDGSRHLPFDPSVPLHGTSDFGGGPLPLLFLPSLDLSASPKLMSGDYAFAVRPMPLARAASSSMGPSTAMVAAATVGDGEEGAALLAGNLSGGTLKPPFNVRTETASNNVGYFLTGSAGYIQNLLYGFTGLRIREQGLVEAYAPMLPPTWSSLTLRNIVFRGQHFDIRVARDPSGNVKLSRQTR